MKQDMIILDEDKTWARERVAELEQQIQALGPEFYDVFNQSSETWHDNAPFDALRDRQSVLDAELQRLRSVLRNSLPSVPKQKKGTVGIGSSVELIQKGGNGKKYYVAGDWTPHAGQEVDGIIKISTQSPLAQQLLGKKPGDMVRVGRKEYTVELR